MKSKSPRTHSEAPLKPAGLPVESGTPGCPSRVVIERVTPEIDGGRFPIKRVVQDSVRVQADIFADGHEELAAVVRWKPVGGREWLETPMKAVGNDRWQGTFQVSEHGRYIYTVAAWIDRFATWRRDLRKRLEAEQDVSAELLVGSALVAAAASRAEGGASDTLKKWAAELGGRGSAGARVAIAVGEELADWMTRVPDRSREARYERELGIWVDRPRARTGAWYELFPRSWSTTPGKHGTLKDVASRLAYVASMGFDVVYLPPIHPIGATHRKGKNNSTRANPGEPGSPWAIGAAEGGHREVHPALGTLADVRDLAVRAREMGLEIALDLAYQCSPDHPYVKKHPAWFRHMPDGTIRYAENPPKKYQDIYPIDFESEDWEGLWTELIDVVRHWVKQGIRIFRVDNPHTKPFPFWERLITTIQAEDPDVLFLAEAFTRPKVMMRLAKLGFSQSYTYFAWRNTKAEITRYMQDLTQTEMQEYFRPNFWPNTPDILTEYLESGGRPAFATRLVLAATLAASYGIYGPAFELVEHERLTPDKEEYLDSEKYEIKSWDLDRPDSLKDLIARVNRIRKENPCLHRNENLRFHEVDNPQLICFSKRTDDGSNTVLVVVNLDPHHAQSGWVELDLEDLGVDPERPFQVHDLLGGARFLWQGPKNFVRLEPQAIPAHVFSLRRRIRSERDFEYYL